MSVPGQPPVAVKDYGIPLLLKSAIAAITAMWHSFTAWRSSAERVNSLAMRCLSSNDL